MTHALVIGGSGMLAKTSLWLAEQYDRVSVIGRSRQRLADLASNHSHIYPVSVDYRNEKELIESLDRIMAYGPVDTVVAWIHMSTAPKALHNVINHLTQHSIGKWKLFHVLGSSSNLDDILRQIEVPAHCEYHQIQLGFVLEGSQSRWLTNDEISGGVIKAIAEDLAKHTVGTLTPWDRRPGG